MHTMRIFSFLTLVVAILCTLPAVARGVEEADSAYARGDYAAAVEIYKATIDSVGVSSELYYDLGNAYAKGGDYGHALVNFLRALRLDPSNRQAATNVKYIEQKVADTNHAELRGKKLSLEPEGKTFFSSLREYICANHPSSTWAVWSVVSFLLFVVCLALYIFTQGVAMRKTGFFGGFIFLGVSLVALIFSFMAAGYSSDEGVITGAKVKLFTEASNGSKENPVALTRGTRMSVLDTFPAGSDNPQWYKVRLNSDFVGWVDAANFETVGI